MIAVIQCAGTKRKHAGGWRAHDGKPVMFVANPETAPTSDACVYARPDDPSDHGGSWRDYLLRYNETPRNNPLALLPAYELYQREIYGALANQIGVDKTYILSAGWGLIPASFLTPLYDITFSPSAEPWKRRARHDAWRDLSTIPSDASEPIVFLGGKDYLPLFVRLRLTSLHRAPYSTILRKHPRPRAATSFAFPLQRRPTGTTLVRVHS